MTPYLQVTTTVSDRPAAVKIADRVLAERLAACVQIGTCHSMYRWQGAIEATDEYLVVMKSRNDLLPELERSIRAVHPYDVPEILATGIAYGGEDYLAWLGQELLPPRQDEPES
ncbi:Periplasmic divalent cation tolerance protein CutA [hydrothermal vent metagenome]|uniref:Periplasmic divalent cation tolerance protein CutA n=1 Tax=hydrothermal vent metagenome TaxID=652676 RepID=A0A3B0V5U2_9ZZZZ